MIDEVYYALALLLGGTASVAIMHLFGGDRWLLRCARFSLNVAFIFIPFGVVMLTAALANPEMWAPIKRCLRGDEWFWE